MILILKASNMNSEVCSLLSSLLNPSSHLLNHQKSSIALLQLVKLLQNYSCYFMMDSSINNLRTSHNHQFYYVFLFISFFLSIIYNKIIIYLTFLTSTSIFLETSTELLSELNCICIIWIPLSVMSLNELFSIISSLFFWYQCLVN